jgi:hypothetical protein
LKIISGKGKVVPGKGKGKVIPIRVVEALRVARG